MPNKIAFTAEPRTLMGKKTSQLRRQGQVPANVMGHNIDSRAVVFNRNQFNRLYNEVGDTGLVYLTISGEAKERPVLVDVVEYDPVSGEVIHVVLKQVNLAEKITAEIPVELVGEFSLPDAVLITVHPSIEVEALPTDLPEKFEINVETLTEVGQAVTFKDLAYDRAKVTLAVSEEELDSPVLLVQEHREEVEETPEVPAEEGGEVTDAAAAPAEGEAPAAEAKE